MALVRALATAIVLCLGVSGSNAERESVSIQLIVDQSGARQGAADVPLKNTLFQMSELRKSRLLQHATINIVSQNQPRNLWVGTPMELFRNDGAVLGKIAPVVNGCSDLVGAFEQVQLNLELQRPSRAYILVFSSLIHTGSPCDVTIDLPQPAPKNLDLSFLVKREISVRFMWVHALQMKPYLEAVRKAELTSAQLSDEETTRRVLQNGLFE